MKQCTSLALSLSVAAATLAGCGGSQPSLGAPSIMPQSRAIARHAAHGKSWMLPEAMSIKRLLYASDTQDVLVFDYDTGKLVGTLTGFREPQGQCVDKDGNVFLTTEVGSTGAVLEYAHGGSNPTATFYTDGHPIGCSISPVGGDLAVDNGTPSGGSDVQVWKHASGNPSTYTNEQDCDTLWSPGYDDRGNLFFENGSHSNVCELPIDGESLEMVPFGGTIGFSGGVMWDGKHITFTDQSYEYGFQTAIYRAKQNRDGSLSVVGTTILQTRKPHYYGDTEVGTPFVVGKKNTPINDQQGTAVVGENGAFADPQLQFWHYPRGGNPYKRARQSVEDASGGVSVSIGP